MEKLDSMTFWTVQPQAVYDQIQETKIYVPTISAGVSKLSTSLQNDPRYIEPYKDLFRYGLGCLYYRLGLINSDGSFTEHGNELIPDLCINATGDLSQDALNDIAPVFAFASVIPSPFNSNALIFKDMSFDEFTDFIAEHLFAIQSLWKEFAEDSVIMKLKVSPADYCAMDINAWQFLMPPVTIVPPFTEEDPQLLQQAMTHPNTIVTGPFPSELYQVLLPFIVAENVVEVHEMVSYDDMQYISDTKFPDAQQKMLEKVINEQLG